MNLQFFLKIDLHMLMRVRIIELIRILHQQMDIDERLRND